MVPSIERRARERFWWVLRTLVTLGAFAFLATHVDARSLGDALARMPVYAALGCTALVYASLALGALRWRVLMLGCGASDLPSFRRLYVLTLIGCFYNTMLPGAVSGDVVRAMAVAPYFGAHGAARSLMASFLDRVSGLLALMLLASSVWLLHPIEGVEGLRLVGSVGVLAVVLGTLAVVFSDRIAPLVPARFGKHLPERIQPSSFLSTLVLSVLNQILIVGMGHLLITAVYPSATFVQSAVAMPLGTLAAYFPLTIAGAGARETALVAAYRLVSVPSPDALAAALTLLACSLVVAASGGIVGLFAGRGPAPVERRA
jgi:glycosyltransferase 2 family protein